ncbi:sigma 54-interacting transcriptional regulator [Lacticaseibacillus thailandensis]|nr:sigma 54-interacting transcriptional regulator [Lacticaseibacillus thailandensis]
MSAVIGSKQSLFSQIKRMKAAARYPGVGLPVLLTGPTGSGKSYLARVYYDYCVYQGYLDQSSSFVHLNCAEYADNPELLASILFGYKRGAYTGADKDSQGLFDQADNGMLFLDEVHRLGAKGQEKLFEYLDNGTISPLGETKSGHQVNVRLIFATTENIQSNFLQTFIRRIPVQVEVPGINERTQFERESLTKLFFLNQSKRINRPIQLSKQVLSILTSQHYDSNVGQMKNYITLTVASALSKAKDDAGPLKVVVGDLPSDIWSNNETEGIRLRLNGDGTFITIRQEMSLQQLVDDDADQDNQIRCIFTRIVGLYNQLGISAQFMKASTDLINTLSDEMIFSNVIDRGEVPLDLMKRMMQAKLDSLEDSFSVKFSGNSLVVIAYFFYYRQFNYWVLSAQTHAVLNEISTKLAQDDARIATFTDEIIKMTRSALSLPVDVVDTLFLQLYLHEAVKVTKDNSIRCLVLAHGYSTASSIANVVNRLVGYTALGCIDMPLDISVETIGQKVSDYIASNQISSGLILMVDMGSLSGIHKYIHGTIDFPIGIITNVSTQSALSVVDQVAHHKAIDEIVKHTAQTVYTEGRTIYPQEVKKNLIITCCNTGIGTANQIKQLLDSSFAEKIDVVVNAYEYSLVSDPNQMAAIKRTYNVLAIVGTVDPHAEGITFIPLEKLILGENSEALLHDLGVVADKHEVEDIVTTILHNFTIERVLNSLTILDATAVMDAIDVVMSRFVELSGQVLGNPQRMALYVHISCMVERLIRNEPITTYDWKHANIDTNIFQEIKSALSVLEAKYSVTVPKAEVAYIYDIIHGN